MTYTCPACSFGNLKATRVTYMREWDSKMMTIPNFAGWRCDSCGYTRYDANALARLELILGPDSDSLILTKRRRSGSLIGPGERGPHRWSI